MKKNEIVKQIKKTIKSQMVIGNWKMNKKYADILLFAKQVNKAVKKDHILKYTDDVVVIAPTYLGVLPLSGLISHEIKVGAQNVHHHLEGAFTGSVSASQLSEFNVKHVIVGHSEVREFNFEKNNVINEKVSLLLNNKMIPILCIGETLKEFEAKKTGEVNKKQLTEALINIPHEKLKNLVIAYEPIWAIGTGKTATNEIIQKICSEIKIILGKIVSEKVAKDIKVLYGGSVKDTNAKSIMELPAVDGVLVGGASLDAKSFINIVKSTKQYQIISKQLAKN